MWRSTRWYLPKRARRQTWDSVHAANHCSIRWRPHHSTGNTFVAWVSCEAVNHGWVMPKSDKRLFRYCSLQRACALPVSFAFKNAVGHLLNVGMVTESIIFDNVILIIRACQGKWFQSHFVHDPSIFIFVILTTVHWLTSINDGLIIIPKYGIAFRFMKCMLGYLDCRHSNKIQGRICSFAVEIVCQT